MLRELCGLVANDDSLPSSDNYHLIGKLVGFVVDGMPLAGKPVNIVISQSMSIPANAMYRLLPLAGVSVSKPTLWERLSRLYAVLHFFLSTLHRGSLCRRISECRSIFSRITRNKNCNLLIIPPTS